RAAADAGIGRRDWPDGSHADLRARGTHGPRDRTCAGARDGSLLPRVQRTHEERADESAPDSRGILWAGPPAVQARRRAATPDYRPPGAGDGRRQAVAHPHILRFPDPPFRTTPASHLRDSATIPRLFFSIYEVSMFHMRAALKAGTATVLLLASLAIA